MEYSQRSQSRPRRPSSSFSNAAGRPQSRNSNHSGDPNHFNPNHPNHPNPNHFDDSCLLMAGLLAAPRRKAAFLEQPPPQQQRRKQLLLAYPTTTADIQELYERVFLHSLPSHHRPLAPPEGCDDVGDNDASAHRGFANGLVPDIMDQRVCMAFGHITKAAVEKTPVLIIIEPGIRQEAPHFININTVDHYISEVELGLPGTFALRQGKNEFRFSATSSLEYQKWENAFYKSMDIVSSNRRSQSVQKRPIHDSQTNSANYSSYWSESNESSRNSMSTMNSTIRNNSINSTTPTTPGSVTSPVIRKSMNDLRAKVMGLKGFGIFKPQHQQQSSPTNYSKSPSQSPIPTINYQRASSYEQTNSPSTIAITSTSTSTSRSIAEDTLQAQPKGAPPPPGILEEPLVSSPSTYKPMQLPSPRSSLQNNQTVHGSIAATTKDLPIPPAPSSFQQQPPQNIMGTDFTTEVLRSFVYDHRVSTSDSDSMKEYLKTSSSSPDGAKPSPTTTGREGEVSLMQPHLLNREQFELSPYVEFTSPGIGGSPNRK